MTDKVSSPKHYTSHPSGIECIQITEHYNFCVGNAIKYLWRQGLKEETGYDVTDKQIEDCRKAIWYIERHIKALESARLSNLLKAKDVSFIWKADKEAVARASISVFSGGKLTSNSETTKSRLECND